MKRNTDCRHIWFGFLLIFFLIAMQWLIPVDSLAQSGNLTIGNYVKVSEKRISRTVYEYTFRADITNSMNGVLNVVATVDSTSPYTTIVDNSLSFGDVPAGAMVVSSDTFSFRQDRLYSFSWSDLAWDIQYQSTPSNTISVGPQGGVLHFPSGIVLEIPSGAVTETVGIEIVERFCTEFDQGIFSPKLSTRPRRCLGGFSAKPSGLVFNVPITAIIPLVLEPGEIPVLMKIDALQQKSWVAETVLIFRGAEGVAEIELQHFSDVWWAALGNHIEKTCQSCDTYMSDVCGSSLKEPNPYFHNLQPGACWLPKSEREQCQTQDVECCMERPISVKVTDVFFSDGECQVVGSKLQIAYPECPGSPTFVDSEAEVSGCPEGMDFKLKIISDQPWIYRCQHALFMAEITGTKDGKILFDSVPFPAVWDIDDGSLEIAKLVGDAGPNGQIVEGLKEGNAVIHARVIGAEDKYFAEHTLEIKELRIDIEPGENLSLSVGENRELWVPFFTYPAEITWTTDKPDVVKLTSLPGHAVLVDAIGRGTATIYVQSINPCGEIIQDSLTVAIKDKQVTVMPNQAAINIGGTQQLLATVIDGDGCALKWYSNDVSIATVTANGLVTGISLGVANITASCGDDANAVAEITVRLSTFVLTWNGSARISREETCVNADLSEYHNLSTVDWTWSGTAFFEDNKNVQTLSTTGLRKVGSNRDGYYISGGIECFDKNVSTETSTITAAGVDEIEKLLEGSGIYLTQNKIRDPLIVGSYFTLSATGHLESEHNSSYNCPPPGMIHHNFSEHDEQNGWGYQFQYDGDVATRYGAPLRPDEAPKTSFSKTVEGNWGYVYDVDCVGAVTGEGKYDIQQSWIVRVGVGR